MYIAQLSIWMFPLAVAMIFAGCQSETNAVAGPIEARHVSTTSDSVDVAVSENNTAILGGGCFWCVEADFEKLPGVTDVVSGYSAGTTQNPTYENYAAGGHVYQNWSKKR